MTSTDSGSGVGWRFADSCFHRTLLLDFMNPAAPFMTFLRKLVMLNGAVAACFGALFVGLIAAAVLRGVPMDLQLSFVTMSTVLTLAPCLIAYVAAFRSGDVADWMLSLLMWGSAAGGVFGVLANVGFPYGVATASFAIFAAICNMPFRLAYFAVLASIYALYAYNTAAALSGDTAPLTVGPPGMSFATILRNYLLGLIIFAVPVAACVLQMRHNKAMLATAEAANELSCYVAELLRAYDTDSVAKLLDEYAARGDADPALVATYRGLVVNLNQYRPHLPNWMVAAAGGGAGDDEDGDEAVSRQSSARTRQSQSTAQTAASRGSRARSSSAAAPVADALNAGAAPRSVTVALAVVEFDVEAAVGAARGALVSAFADRVHKIAAATHCAVHSFVGDTVQLSWNATVKAVQPEVKAARFLARLQAAMRGDDVRVNGAAAHGKATTQFAGTGGVQTLAISAAWRATLRTLAAFAAAHRAMVVAESMAVAAQHAVTCRPVEALSVGGATVVVHEVIQERDDDDDEWMYVLAKTGGDVVGDALRACLEGDYGTAVSKLAGLVEAGAALPSTVANLRDRAEAALGDPAAPFPVAGCHCAKTALQMSES
jgi:hypothetical protein